MRFTFKYIVLALLLFVYSGPGRAQNAGATQSQVASQHSAQEAVSAYVAGQVDRNSYAVNRRVAGLLLQEGRLQEAVPYLQHAQKIQPGAYENEYDLAQAYLLIGKAEEARTLVQEMLAEKPSGELHNLSGRIAERQGRYIDAVHEFEYAARLDPSEDNIFVWGSELLAHRTYVPAIEVFKAGSEKYPQSSRLLVGFGMSQYAHGDVADSVQSLLKATDAEPHDARGYLYLSKAYLSAPDQAEAAIQHFKRYAELEPTNALAQFYYAMSLWKGKRVESASPDYGTIEALLKRSIDLNGNFADAHLQLGILYSDQHAYDKARPQYERALQLAPQMPEAHFRMGRYYLQAGMKERADAEFAMFRRLEDQKHAAEDKAKAEVQQFVIANPGAEATHP